MELNKAILAEHSKPQAVRIARYVGKDQDRFKILMELFFKEEYRIAQRAAWPVGICVEEHPELIKPYLRKLVNNLKKPVHDAVKRNTVRIFEKIEIPEKFMGEIADLCFGYVSTPSETIAVRAYAITVLFNLTKKQPELKYELKIVLEDQLPYASAAFLSRAKKVLKALDKIH